MTMHLILKGSSRGGGGGGGAFFHALHVDTYSVDNILHYYMSSSTEAEIQKSLTKMEVLIFASIGYHKSGLQ